MVSVAQRQAGTELPHPTVEQRVARGKAARAEVPRSSHGAFAPAPDGSVWGSVLGFPGALIRLSPGANPPETALSEVFEPPFDNPKAPVHGFSPRGMDIDRNGVVWTALASGHLASFDRRKCKGPLNGPNATGQHCPEGWTFYA